MARSSTAFFFLVILVIIAVVSCLATTEDGNKNKNLRMLKRITRSSEKEKRPVFKIIKNNVTKNRNRHANQFRFKKRGNIYSKKQRKENRPKYGRRVSAQYNNIRKGKKRNNQSTKSKNIKNTIRKWQVKDNKRIKSKKKNRNNRKIEKRKIINKRKQINTDNKGTVKNMKKRKNKQKKIKKKKKTKGQKKINKTKYKDMRKRKTNKLRSKITMKNIGRNEIQNKKVNIIQKQQNSFDECIDNAENAWKMNNNQMKNFIKQYKQITRQYNLIKRKTSKRRIFVNNNLILDKIIKRDTSNCDKSSPIRSNVDMTVQVLNNCEEKIREKCSSTEVLNDALLGILVDCNTEMQNVKAKMEKCLNVNDVDLSCQCFSAVVSMTSRIQYCIKQSKETNAKVKEELKKCKSTFTTCKTNQGKILNYIGECHKFETFIHPTPPTTTERPMGSTKSRKNNRFLKQMMEKNIRANAKRNHFKLN